MIDLDLELSHLPRNPARLAVACLFLGISPPCLVRASAEEVAEFGSYVGMTLDELLDAINWLAEYYEENPPQMVRLA